MHISSLQVCWPI